MPYPVSVLEESFPMRNLRILIADDHELVRKGIRTLLEVRRGWSICGEAATARERLRRPRN